jgi:hypothetical protein
VHDIIGYRGELTDNSVTSLAAGWPDEFVKKSPKM